MKLKFPIGKQTLTSLSFIAAGFIIASLFSRSALIAIAFALFIAIFIFIAQKRGGSKRKSAIHGACPEMIDILISGVQSGLSLNESLAGLAQRGPEVFKDDFQRFTENLYRDGNFNNALIEVKETIAHPSFDQIVEALLIARELGGAELLTILRLLGKFIREDLSLRREIDVKQNWIKNSAHLSAAAPWILLLLLSTQPSTSQAFSTPAGLLILGTGLGITAVAYLWMNSLSRIPDPNRIFIDVLHWNA
jgi:tight adherence protein B